MDSFVSRKRRKISPSPDSDASPGTASAGHLKDEEESTEFKLAILSSIHPEFNEEMLLDILLAHEGSVEKATNSPLLERAASSPKKKSKSAVGYQSSLQGFATTSSSNIDRSKRPRLMSKKGKILHLFSPEDIATHTPCSIIHNFLPAEEADELLLELLPQAETFERMTFKLFDNVVTSPHTACFFVDSLEEQNRQKTEYVYNGSVMTDVRLMTGRLLSIKEKVQQTVNAEIDRRMKSHNNGVKPKYQSPKPWTPNAACVNQYNGPQESVGYHSDQMTYLGPKAVIGSLSLGVAREFRIRRVIPKDGSATDSDNTSSADLAGQISIHLPHNSLLVMHAGMQEEWKHSVAPAQAIDPHHISGNRRINITYRDYRPSLHPNFTPKCRCGIAAILRVVQKRKENYGRYFWHCYAGNVPGKESCEYFEWAVFSEDGEPIWKKRPDL